MNYNRADQLRTVAARVNNDASRLRMMDIFLFTRWLEASSAGSARVAKLYEDHFPPEFRPAFDAWRRSPTVDSSLPFTRPEYREQRTDEARVVDDSADGSFGRAAFANNTSDRYIFVTVIMATVLFFAGAVRPLVKGRAKDIILVCAIVLCLIGVVRVLVSPIIR